MEKSYLSLETTKLGLPYANSERLNYSWVGKCYRFL